MSVLIPRVLVTAGAVLALGLLPTAAAADPGGDPAGNNGTIKINPYGVTEGNANHPHPGCDFRLQLFGFDDDQTGTITFTGQAPTADAVTAQPLSGTQLLSDDAARGGQDDDAFFDVRGADLGLTGTPHAQQGYHVKVRVDADDAPGGAKTKVFWLDCPAPATAPAAAPATSTSTSTSTGTGTGTTDAPATASGTTTTPAKTGSTTVTTTAVQGETSGAALGGATVGLASPEVSAQGRSSALSTFTGGSAGAARTDAVATGRTGAPGGDASALPFTGVPALGLAALGLGALAAGTLAVRAGRRRTSQV